MMLAGDTQAEILEALAYMTRYAKQHGWVKTRTGWVCAYCAPRLGLKV